jgi:prefoldin subunit 5
MSEEIHRDLGKHDAQIEALNAQVNRMYVDMQQMMGQLTTIQQTLSEAKGGWKTLMWVGGLSAALGGIVVKVMTWLQILPK